MNKLNWYQVRHLLLSLKSPQEDLELSEKTHNSTCLSPSSLSQILVFPSMVYSTSYKQLTPSTGESGTSPLMSFTIGQHEITAIIELEMAKLRFQGAGGWVEFNKYPQYVYSSRGVPDIR